ncbi:phosphoglycerate transporter protein PgtP [Parachlamydia sp. AcF125]|uniref:phosphoglycerate transporter protein PgtP n=1 Tax=Parachlamydia sp. AcF125 TaxID=2795736 RepID=UPI001BC93697|nr:phosphoglycerate transporter protein PgtP [Parachlamydia sp. AcF125]MBS4167538.1 Membrane sensor protein UhpC [Parachlamydia sp. AcF125]
MRFLPKFLEPAPNLPEIQDQEEISKQYKYWRIRILYSMFIGYALFYFTRKSYTFAMPSMVAELGYDKSQLGILASVFSIAYGTSKFASGIVSDQSNARYFMAIGLMITGVINILFGMSSTLFFFILFWGLNGWFQGWGWPPCARLLTHWYSHSERGSWWSTWNVSHNVGAFLIPWVVGFCIYYFDDWRAGMYVPGMVCILSSFYLINRLRDTPQSIGLPSIEKFHNEMERSEDENGETKISTKEILMEYILKNPMIWLLSFAYFFVYFIRTGVNDWTALYLIEVKGYTQLKANGCVSLFEVGGFFGNLVAGWASDYFFSARRGPVNVLFSVLMLLSILAFWLVPGGYPWLDSISMLALGFAIFGPQLLIGVACVELSHKKAAATATGFAGWFAYMGAAASGYPLGKISQEIGWAGFFIALVVCGIFSIALLLPSWSITKRSKTVVNEESIAKTA